MEKVSALEARKNLGRLLNIVLLKNEDVLIERSGKPVAKLTSIESGRTSSSGKRDFRKLKGVGKELWKKVNADDYISGERNQWE